MRGVIEGECQGCHQPRVKSSNLDLTTYEGFQSGGKRGAAAKIVVSFLTGESKPQMPLGLPPLPPEQVELFRAWIAAGAKDDTRGTTRPVPARSEEHTSELQSHLNLVCRLLLEKKNTT